MVAERDAAARDVGHSAVAAACPAFSEGCPYATSDQIVEWIKAKRPDAISTCPAFKEGCPFSEVRDLDALCKELQKLPPSHAGLQNAEGSVDASVPKPAHDALVGMLQAVHQASQRVKEAVGGECPVFQQACPFKNCMTSSGTPLVQELETRTWGLFIHGAEGDVTNVDAEGKPSAEHAQSPEEAAEDEGLARKLKEGTKEAHKAAETVHFVREFIKGRVPREIYAQFVVNLYHVYEALEEALDACADHPLVDPLYLPDELRRAPSLRTDAEYFVGPDWEDKMRPTPVAVEYAERLRQVAKEAPELVVPHAYTRYLGDLSGGQVLRRAAVRGLKLPDDGSGVRFYCFKRIRDGKVFKNMYRARLDALGADRAVADSMVVEANAAFNFNTRMFQELDALGGFVAEEPAPLLTATASSKTPAADVGAASGPGAAAACPFAALAASGVPMPKDHPPLAQPAKPAPAAAAKPAPAAAAAAAPRATAGLGRNASPSRPGPAALVALAVALVALAVGLAGRLAGRL